MGLYMNEMGEFVEPFEEPRRLKLGRHPRQPKPSLRPKRDTCKWCGGPLPNGRSDRKYCSNKCRANARKLRKK